MSGPSEHTKKYIADKQDYSQDYAKTLQMKKDTILMTDVGYVNVAHPKHVPIELLDSCKRYGVAQALLDNIAQSSKFLVVRNFLVDVDFVNSAREKILTSEWVQPRAEGTSHGYNGWSNTDQDQLVYESCASSKNDRKVLILYGIKNLKYDEAQGGIQANAAGSKAEVNCSSAKLMRANVKILEIPDLSLINDYGFIWFETPFLFKRGDDISFYLRPKHEALGKTDNLMLLGMTIEALGTTIAP